MSKSVRLPDYLAAEVERLAREEKRSLANMVQVLLEQALAIESGQGGFLREAPATGERREAIEIHEGTVGVLHEPERASGDIQVEPDFK